MADKSKKNLPSTSRSTKTNLPALVEQILPRTFTSQNFSGKHKAQLPNASIVYGVGAGVFFVISIASLFRGAWFTSLLVFCISACFAGFAAYFIKKS